MGSVLEQMVNSKTGDVTKRPNSICDSSAHLAFVKYQIFQHRLESALITTINIYKIFYFCLG